MGNRFLRNKDLIPQHKLNKIQVIGLGGIGSALVHSLAIMGWKKIHLWDDDKLKEHNLSCSMYQENSLGMFKVAAAADLIRNYNKESLAVTHPYRFVTGNAAMPITAVCTDDMESRMVVYDAWRMLGDSRRIFLDMRMGATVIEVIIATKEDDHWVGTWQPSRAIPDEPCTMKHTIFAGSLSANLGTAQLFNALVNNGFWSYIKLTCNPMQLVTKEFVKPKRKKEVHGN
tara:strand:+ start:1743 stop:2429 length:687 start_codon:yes stop_codon:yes gene_type:complete